MGNKTTKLSNIKIASKLPGIRVKSINPRFSYMYQEADVPFEMPQNHAEKILKNDNFYISDKDVKKTKKRAESKPRQEKTWLEELNEVKGLSPADIDGIIYVYPKKSNLLEALSHKGKLPLETKMTKKLKEAFIH